MTSERVVYTANRLHSYGRAQTKEYKGSFSSDGKTFYVKANVSFDDRLGNGHNTFSITGEVREKGTRKPYLYGCCHEEIAKAIPELRPYIKWHLCNSDGPLYYIQNGLYLLENEDTEGFARTIVWGAMEGENQYSLALLAAIHRSDLQRQTETGEKPWRVRSFLMDRLPALMSIFRKDVESLGFEWDFDSFPNRGVE